MPLRSRRTGWGRWLRLLCAAGVAAALALTPAVASPVATAAGCLRVQPQAGPPTTEVDVFGCGFWPHETVTVMFGMGRVGRAWTNDRGEFSTMFMVAVDAKAGMSTVTATGGNSRVSASANFVVRSGISSDRMTWQGPG